MVLPVSPVPVYNHLRESSMRTRIAYLSFLVGVGALCFGPLYGTVERALELERAGQPSEARRVLRDTVTEQAGNGEALIANAEFLDRYGDPAAIEAYLAALETAGPDDTVTAAELRRRIAVAALWHGDAEQASAALKALQAAGEGGPGVDGLLRPLTEPETTDFIDVPGTRDSFSRMAALSTDLSSDLILPSLGRTIFTGGYHASGGGATFEPTEYLRLLKQYLTQARELAAFAGADNTIAIPVCESAETAQLLKIIGYRLRGECGPAAVLETVNPSRAFLAIDSAFPLADLELAFRRGEPFSYQFGPTRLPVLFGRDYWLGAARRAQDDFLDTFIDDPGLARLYVAMHNLHRPTAEALRAAVPVSELKDYVPVLDFFGAMFEVRDGVAVTPGGDRARPGWERMVGVNASQGGRFFQQLIRLDDGWMAAYYDALARVQGDAARAYFLEPQRIERFYQAVRGKVTSPGPARPIFRASSDLLLLSTRLDFTASGAPRIPGGIEPWKDLFVVHPHGKYDGKLTQSATRWTQADDVIEAMFALSRKAIENEPLRMFLSISDLDRNRATPLSAEVVGRMIRAFPAHGHQFALYSDSPDVSEETITAHLDTMVRLDKIGSDLRRANAIGVLQAQQALWQVLRRNGAIPPERADASMQALLSSAAAATDSQGVFEAGRAGVLALLEAAGKDAADPQQTLLDLLVGTAAVGEQDTRAEVLARVNQLLTLQRLVPLDTLFDLADHLERVSRGEAFNVAMANRLSESISDIRLPRSVLSVEEANAMARGHWVDRHIQRQRNLNLRRAVDRAQGNPRRLLGIRGELAPILRDSLVGIAYALYSPPGAELIRANPLFVRSHDFLGPEGKYSWARARMQSTGWPSSGGGRLMGSLVSLPYELASAEQNFMIPSERQALIWQDLAPQMLLGATLPRWWGVQPADLHYVGLHLRLARSLLAQAAFDQDLAGPVLAQLRTRVEPSRIWKIEDSFRRGRVREGIEIVTPAELFDLANRMRASQGARMDSVGQPYVAAIAELESRQPQRFNERRSAQMFGMPHPRLAHSYRLELLHLPLFPTLMGFSSRILAESWESNNLFWAALFDELHIAPAQLNLLIPQWTQRTLERIFATHLDDWPALWRSLRIIADQVRREGIPSGVAPAPSTEASGGD